ncbi:MAG: bacteriocin transport accessory protein [Lachnospiraceae bacterium]|nr:bacteriocin transport accessory protein [Lachnospiraceae bacterium]
MKKLVALMLAAALAVSVTACGGGTNTETTKDDTEGKKAVDILTDVYAAYEEDEKFSIAGGDYENMVMDAPGTVNVANGETLDTLLGFPADSAELLDDAASMMHMMNQNTFTAGVYHVVNADDVQTVADAIKENILNRQWMCGFPDDLVIYSVGTSYVAAVFGAGDLVDNFEEELQETYSSAKLLHEEDLNF